MALTQQQQQQIIDQAYKDHAAGKPRLLPRKAPPASQPADSSAPQPPANKPKAPTTPT